MTKREEKRRQEYYKAFSDEVLRLTPENQHVKINWSEIEYGCLMHHDPKVAAADYVNNPKED